MARSGGRTVRRHRLSAPFLQALQQARVGVVSAGPGYGKTTFLSELGAAWPHAVEHAAPRTAADLAWLARLAAAAAVPLLLLLDDAHRLGGEAASLERLIADLPPRHRLVVATRGDGLAPAHGWAAHGPLVTGLDLLLSPGETADALGAAHAAAAAVHAATAGWPEGVRLLAEGMAGGREAADAGTLIGEALRRRLELLHPGAAGIDALLRARVPVTRGRDGAWTIPPPLARCVPGELLPAHPAAEAGGTRTVAGATDPLAPAALRDLGHGILGLLREAELRGDAASGGLLLARALSAFEGERGEIAELLEAERLRGLIARGFATRARHGALLLLHRTSSDAVRARALDVLGRAARRDGGEQHLLLAADLLAESLALWRRLGDMDRVEEARLRLAHVDLDLGLAQRALRRAESVAVANDAPAALVWAARLMRLQALADLGHEGDVDLLPGQNPPLYVLPAVVLLRAQAALLRDRPDEAARHLQRFDPHRGRGAGLLRPARALAAAELWCRTGSAAHAIALAAWARRSPTERTAAIALGFAAIEARAGDALAGLAAIDELLDAGRVPPRELWRAHLLASMAAARAGRSPAPRLDQALRTATAIGQTSAPYIREREMLAEILDTPGVWRSGAPA
jgi:hypothetical protein